MPTFNNLINDALKVIGVLAAGATPAPEHSEDALAVVARMLDAFNAQRLCIGTVIRTTYTWVAAQSQRTIGTAGQLVGPRPLWLDNAGVIPPGQTLEIPLGRPMSRDDYAGIAYKALTGTYFYRYLYEPTFPSGTLTVYPVPTGAPTLVLYVPTALTSVALTTDLSYAPGAEEAVLYQLARRLAPMFKRVWSQDNAQLARESLATWKRSNVRIESRQNDPTLVGRGGYFDIESGMRR